MQHNFNRHKCNTISIINMCRVTVSQTSRLHSKSKSAYWDNWGTQVPSRDPN